MSYTAWEIIIFLLLAFLLGAFLVWLWMRNRGDTSISANASGDVTSLRADLSAAKDAQAKAQGDLAACRKNYAELEAKLASAQMSGSGAATAAVAGAAGLAAGASAGGSAKADAELQAKLDAATSAKAKAEADLAAANKKIAAMSSDLDACKDARAELEMKLNSAPAPAASGKKEAFTTDAPKPAEFQGDALAAAKANPDDLKEIWGVGPVMERVLNEQGCYTFKQVAALSDRDVEWVAANINTFPDRITRDDWVGQAKTLAAKKGS